MSVISAIDNRNPGSLLPHDPSSKQFLPGNLVQQSWMPAGNGIRPLTHSSCCAG